MEVVRKLFPYLRKHLKYLAVGLLGMGVFTLLSLLPPLLLRYLVDEVVQPRSWELLVPVVVLIILVPSIGALVQFANTWIISLSGYRIIADIRKDMYGRIFDLSMRFHQDHASGLIVNRLMDDVNMLMRLITGDTVNIVIDLIVFIFSVSIVFSLSPLLAGVLFVTLALYVLAYRTFSGKIRSATTSYRFMHDRISERLQETVAGVRHVRIFNREPLENDRFLTQTRESLGHALTSNLNSVALGTACNLIAGFGSAVLAALGAYYVLTGSLRYGDVLAINSYIWLALNPAIRLTNLAGQLTETFVSVRRVIEIIETDPEITSPPDAPAMQRGDGKVEFADVQFSYVPETKLYDGLSLTVEPGSTVALVGRTGCGKTTLTTLLMRYWDIGGGSIMIDGVDIRTVTLRSLRSLFGVVLQNPVVFDETLAANIAYGMPSAPREQIVEAAKAAEIHEMAMRLPDGYDTLIGTNGVKLSVGEKQRVSIARAILKDPVILIMDEATSALDSESEALIQKALSKVLVGRTSFVVAHRLSTITSADMIVVMDEGKIVETGTHEQLMAMPNGRYAHLYEELRGSVSGEHE